MSDVLNADFALAEKNTLYRCLDKLVAHKDALFKFLGTRWGELIGAKFEVLLYDLTSTYSNPIPRATTTTTTTNGNTAIAGISALTAGRW